MDGCHGATATSQLRWTRRRVDLIKVFISTSAFKTAPTVSDVTRLNTSIDTWKWKQNLRNGRSPWKRPPVLLLLLYLFDTPSHSPFLPSVFRLFISSPLNVGAFFNELPPDATLLITMHVWAPVNQFWPESNVSKNPIFDSRTDSYYLNGSYVCEQSENEGYWVKDEERNNHRMDHWWITAL